DAAPGRRDQPLGFVEADRPGRDRELIGKLADGVQAIGMLACPLSFWRGALAAPLRLPCAHLPLALRRWSSSALSSFLESLPIMVLGSASRNSISAGSSILEILGSRCLRMSSLVAVAPALSLMNAFGASPRYSSLRPIT